MGADLLAQVAYVDVDDVRARIEIVAPHVVQKLDTREHLLGVGHEEFQHGEFARRKLDVITVNVDFARAQVERQAAERHRRRRPTG